MPGTEYRLECLSCHSYRNLSMEDDQAVLAFQDEHEGCHDNKQEAQKTTICPLCFSPAESYTGRDGRAIYRRTWLEDLEAEKAASRSLQEELAKQAEKLKAAEAGATVYRE